MPPLLSSYASRSKIIPEFSSTHLANINNTTKIAQSKSPLRTNLCITKSSSTEVNVEEERNYNEGDETSDDASSSHSLSPLPLPKCLSLPPPSSSSSLPSMGLVEHPPLPVVSEA